MSVYSAVQCSAVYEVQCSVVAGECTVQLQLQVSLYSAGQSLDG